MPEPSRSSSRNRPHRNWSRHDDRPTERRRSPLTARSATFCSRRDPVTAWASSDNYADRRLHPLTTMAAATERDWLSQIVGTISVQQDCGTYPGNGMGPHLHGGPRPRPRIGPANPVFWNGPLGASIRPTAPTLVVDW